MQHLSFKLVRLDCSIGNFVVITVTSTSDSDHIAITDVRKKLWQYG